MSDTNNYNGQIIYFSHGGGPLPILNEASHHKMIEFMKNLPTLLKTPEAVVVFSAHWEEDRVAIQSGREPGMVYDYYGFPEEAYSLKYPCKGDPELASRIAELLAENSIPFKTVDNRPYDHGSYIPLKMMYPNADIPVLQVSLHHNLDPETHLNIGKALRPLLKDNVLVIGSGFSFHNMRQFDFRGGEKEDKLNNEFQDALIEICCRDKDEEYKWNQLVNWDKITGARYCHPREEHLLPLLVCVGLSGGVGTKVFDDYILGKRATAFLWR